MGFLDFRHKRPVDELDEMVGQLALIEKQAGVGTIEISQGKMTALLRIMVDAILETRQLATDLEKTRDELEDAKKQVVINEHIIQRLNVQLNRLKK